MSELIDVSPSPPAAATQSLNTTHARDMLRKRYAAPEWAFMEEVAPATGGGTRYADGVAMNLWSSRGHAVHGFEIKVSRSDWLRELKDPAKAEPVYRYCDHWWIVAPKGVVKPGELPPTWGHMELRATGLVICDAAPRLEAAPLSRAFFASMMRRGHESIERLAEFKVRAAILASQEQIDQRVADGLRRRNGELEELKKRLDEFEAKTGMKIDRWNGPPIGAIKMAQQLQRLDGYGEAGSLKALHRLEQELQRCADDVRKAIAESGLGQPAEGAAL